jgi:hypothetical protein
LPLETRADIDRVQCILLALVTPPYGVGNGAARGSRTKE